MVPQGGFGDGGDVDSIQNFVVNAAHSPWIWLVLFLICALDAFFPPLPSDEVVIALSAVAASTGSPDLWPVVLVATVGAVVGDNIVYALGRWIGVDRFAWMRRPRMVAAIGRARGILGRRGAVIILTARFIPVGRVAVNLVAGGTRYPRRRFVPLIIAAAGVWAVFTVAVGSVLGSWLEDRPLLAAGVGVGFALVLGVTVDRFVAWRTATQRRHSDGRD